MYFILHFFCQNNGLISKLLITSQFMLFIKMQIFIKPSLINEFPLIHPCSCCLNTVRVRHTHIKKAFLPKSFFTSSTLMYMLTLGLLTPEGPLGFTRQPAPSSSSRKKKPPSLHSTEWGQPRDSGGVPEPRINPSIAVEWLAVVLGVPRSPMSFSSVCEVNPGGQHSSFRPAAAPPFAVTPLPTPLIVFSC